MTGPQLPRRVRQRGANNAARPPLFLRGSYENAVAAINDTLVIGGSCRP